MSNSAPARPARRKRRWLIRISVAVVVLAALALGAQSLLSLWSDAELAEIYTQLDREDPNWRLEDIEAHRREVPDEENSALHCNLVASALGRQRISSQFFVFTTLFDKLPAQAQLNFQQLKFLQERMTKLKKAVAEARKLKDLPNGRFPVTYTPDYYSTDFTDLEKVLHIQELLHWDAAMLVHAGNADEAMESCRALLNAGRAIGDDPRGPLIRYCAHTNLKLALERVLAQGTPSESALKLMQEELAKEIAEPTLRNALRGQLAGCHHLMTSLESGRTSVDSLINSFRLNFRRNLLNMVAESPKKEHAEMLRIFMEIGDATNLPWPEEEAASNALEIRLKKTSSVPWILVSIFSNAKLGASSRRSQAHLRCAMTAVAAERYRLAHKAWPKTLDDLVAAKLLDAVPGDPFANTPLRLKHTPGGIVIYSVGADGQDNGGNVDFENSGASGTDIGFRLWNLSARRQAPLPTVTIDASDYRK